MAPVQRRALPPGIRLRTAQRRLHQRPEARPLGLVHRAGEPGHGRDVGAGTVFAFEQRAVELPKDNVGSPVPGRSWIPVS